MNYSVFFDHLKNDLSVTPGIRLEHFEVGKGLLDGEVKLIEQSFDVTIDDEIKSFYQQVNGVYVKWLLDDAMITTKELPVDMPIIGEINILDLETVFMGYNSSYWEDYIWFDHMEESLIEKLQHIKPFDFFDNHDSECVCFKREGNYLQSENLRFYKTNKEPMNVGINLNAYIMSLKKTKGIQYWQQAFLLGDKHQKERLEKILGALFEATDE